MFIHPGVNGTRRGLSTQGLIVSVLLFLSTIDEFLYLMGLVGACSDRVGVNWQHLATTNQWMQNPMAITRLRIGTNHS